jgi:pimeloyl-ACP methyl ester carboxylesterase
MRSPRRWGAVLAAALATTACAATGDAGAPSTPPPVPRVEWQACGDGLDCATLLVPVDHADPDGATVPLALVRHQATDPARRLGALLYNPGGPGGGAADVVRQLATPQGALVLSPEVTARYDVIGMDPRGVAGSAGIACLSDADREAELARDLDPAVPGGLALPELTAAARRLADGCARSVDGGLLAQVSTDAVARDMDVVRAALDEERISFLGVSYGTLLGATYATMFPSRVQRMVLDAPLDPELWRRDPLAATAQQAVSGERVLDAWFATCRAEGPACTFGGGQPAQAFDALIARLEAQPLPAAAAGAVPAGRVDGADALLAARTAVFDRRLWPALTSALVAAERGDGTPLHLLGSLLVRDPDGTPSALPEANLAVNCLDRDMPADIAAHQANAAEIRSAAPRFGTLSGYVFLPCARWPAENPDRYLEPLTGAGASPILVVGGREDSQAPYPWAEAMASVLKPAVLLTREGVGHGSYRASGPCVDGAVERYLLDGSVPAPGTACPQEPPATTIPPG